MGIPKHHHRPINRCFIHSEIFWNYVWSTGWVRACVCACACVPVLLSARVCLCVAEWVRVLVRACARPQGCETTRRQWKGEGARVRKTHKKCESERSVGGKGVWDQEGCEGTISVGVKGTWEWKTHKKGESERSARAKGTCWCIYTLLVND